MNPAVEAALIAGAVTLVGTTATALVTRAQLASERRKQRDAVEAVRQSLHGEILSGRVSAYSALWTVMIAYDLNWSLEGRALDGAWISAFLKALNDCNAAHGVFFAEPVYARFVEYRECVVELHTRAMNGEQLVESDLRDLIRASAGTAKRSGLATELKDGIGAYVPSYLQVDGPNLDR